MLDKSYDDYDSFNFKQIIDIITSNKWKLLLFSALPMVFVFVIFHFQESPNFKVKTVIKPIPTSEFVKYEYFNNFSKKNYGTFFTIANDREEKIFKTEEIVNENYILQKQNQISLQQIYLEELFNVRNIKHLLNKYKLFSKKGVSENEYNEKIKKFINKFKLTQIQSKYVDKYFENNYVLEAEYNNKKKWLEFIENLHITTNEKVRNIIITKHKNIIKSLKNDNAINVQMLKNEIESRKKSFYLIDMNRIRFLQEQAEIARKLNIAGNVESKLNLEMAIQENSPYYYRGYESIEKEIELIQSRNKKNIFFNDELVELQSRLKNLIDNFNTINYEKTFNTTPFTSKENFVAAEFLISTGTYEENKTELLVIFLSGLIGLFTGIIYLFTRNFYYNNNLN